MEKRILFSLFFSLNILYGFTARADSLDQRQLEKSVIAGRDLLMNRKYDEALRTFQRIVTNVPEHPVGYLFQAAVLQARMMDYENYRDERTFYALIEKTITIAEKNIQRNKKDAYAHFWSGFAYGFRGFHDAKLNRWIGGLRDGWRGLTALEKAVEINPTLYDAYLGIGTYNYWRSRMTQKLSWLPFFPDRRKEGMAQLRLVAEKGQYGSVAAKSLLVWVYVEEKQYLKSVTLAKKLLDQYPDSRILLWGLATTFHKKGDMQEAKRLYERMLASYQSDLQNNKYSEILCRWEIANIDFKNRNYKECVSQCRQILAYKLEPDVRKRLKDKLEKTRNLLNQAVKQT